MNPTASKVTSVEVKGLLVTSHLILDSSRLDNVQQDFLPWVFSSLVESHFLQWWVHHHLGGVITDLMKMVRKKNQKIEARFLSTGLSDDEKCRSMGRFKRW